MIRRRGSILLAVSLLVVIAALVAAGVLWSVDADGAAERWRRRDDELRAVALGGVRIAMTTLQSQRADILGGADFEPPSVATIYEDEESLRRAVVHFEPFPGRPDAPERRAIPMAALCPVNQVDSTALVTLGFGEPAARGIIERRPAGGYALPEDLPPSARADPTRTDALNNGGADESPAALLTTTSWDANRPAAPSLPLRQGRDPRRLLLGAGLDEADRSWLTEAVGADSIGAVAPLAADPSWKGRTLADAVKSLVDAGLSPRQVGAALDLLAADRAAFPKGRIDIGRAPARVLMTLPGIDEALAERLVAGRASLDAKARANIAWPLEQQVIEPARFAAIVDRITGRSLQWRVRIRAEFEPAGGSRAAPDPAGGPVQERRPSVTFDVILDAAGEAVRVVSMHESTWEQVANAARTGADSVPAVESAEPAAQPMPQTSSEISEKRDAPRRRPLIIKDEEPKAEQGRPKAAQPGRDADEAGRLGRWRPR